MNDKNQQRSKKELLKKGWTYLFENFHKFNEDNKIKIALTLCVKDMPTQLEGDVNFNVTQKESEEVQRIARESLQKALESPN